MMPTNELQQSLRKNEMMPQINKMNNSKIVIMNLIKPDA